MNFEEFKSHYCTELSDYLWIHPADNQPNGGRITFKEIDRLDSFNNIEKVMITGLRQDTFEYFIEKYADRYKHIHFFKNRLIEDLTPLESLSNMTYLQLCFNERVSELWNMSSNTNLEGLVISSFTKLHSLDRVQTSPKLKHLIFEDAVFMKSTLTDLQPLLHTRLESFSFGGKKILNDNISLCWQIPTMQHLNEL